MTSRFSQLIQQFSGCRVLVIGEAMLDTYLAGPTNRLCQEAPVPVVTVESRRDVPGGAANTAINLRSFGAEPVFLSAVGDDREGHSILKLLESQGVTTDHISVDRRRQTLAKHRVLAGSHLVVRFDQGTTTALAADTEHDLLERLISLHRQCDAIVVSDYRYGILTPRLVRCLAHLQRRRPKVLLVDSKRLPYFRDARVAAVKPNYAETLELLALADVETHRRVALIEAHGRRVLEESGARLAAVTMDIDGALFFESDQPAYRTYAKPHPHSQSAGAGDTFLAALALSLACGADTATSAELASAAAAVVVGKQGTSFCTSDELEDQLCTPEKIMASRSRLSARCELYRHQGKRTVLTNGCFDILHPGHVAYLNQAKALGDVLIVAINSDRSVRRLKGPARPINAEEDRLQVLAGLSCVDHLTVFDEPTPIELIEAVRPDVFVKGGDYTRESLPEAGTVERLGGEVHILPFVADRSTSNIIERIRQLEWEDRQTAAHQEGNTDGQQSMANGSQYLMH
jgi:D-beta-D-heptose 7-phosphate kinase/D-beta-D-heptose 1-phosphate adenosyltransferase